jgi:hypothetical protein
MILLKMTEFTEILGKVENFLDYTHKNITSFNLHKHHSPLRLILFFSLYK